MISVILAAPGRTGSQLSRVMSVARPPTNGSSPNLNRSRVEVQPVLRVETLPPHDDALIVTFRIGGCDVKKVLVD